MLGKGWLVNIGKVNVGKCIYKQSNMLVLILR